MSEKQIRINKVKTDQGKMKQSPAFKDTGLNKKCASVSFTTIGINTAM